jgi:membrane-associated protease RseP (regulator of RpoE activity)
MNLGLWITALVFMIYFALVYTASKTGWLERHNMTLALGVIIMWRTQRGKVLIERLASRERLWRAYGNVSIAIVLLFMAIMFGLLVWQSFLVVRIPPGIIKPQQMLGIPGVNPVIPLWFGIFGLAVAMFVHEMAHGVLTRVGKMPIKSLGLLYLVVPIGAFVEPDEEQLAKVDKGRRSRVFAVGPATNIIVGLLVVMLFAWGFMGSLEPVEDGVVLNYVVDEQSIESEGGETLLLKTPASEAGLKPWSIITEIESLDNNTIGPGGQSVSRIRNTQDFLDTMDRTHAGEMVRITWWHDGRFHDATVALWDRGDVYDDEASNGKGYLGASSRLTTDVPAGEYPDALAHPLRYADDAQSFRDIAFFYISLPFMRPTLQPAPEGVTQAFEVHGPLAALGDTGFWLVANLLYWIFWLNMMVGIFNALPAIPLDGGYIFRDGLTWLIERLRPGRSKEAIEGLTLKATLTLSVLILFLILWQFIGPSVGAMVGL